jgi:hypothetical protein
VPPSTGPDDEREQLKPLVQQALTPGDTWYLVSARWWSTWKDYVRFHSYSPQGAPRPGPINNPELLYHEGKVCFPFLRVA